MTRKDIKNVEIDLEFYQKYLDDKNISEAKKKELIVTVWSIIQSFVKIGYYVHPVQQSHKNCVQVQKKALAVPQDDSDEVESVNKDLVEAFIASQDKETTNNKGGHTDA